MEELDTYAWAGHKALIRKAEIPFQDRQHVLFFFSDKEKQAIRAYWRFVEQGVPQGRRPEFTGGGLIRSLGGTINRRDRVLTDERVLGTGDFVKQLIEKAPHPSASHAIEEMEQIIQARCRKEEVSPKALKAGSRSGNLPKLRSKLVMQLVSELGLSYAEIGRNLGITTSGVCRILMKARSQPS
jgi:hypothetical protein